MKTKLQKLFLTLLTLAASSQKLGVNLIRVAILVIFVWIPRGYQGSDMESCAKQTLIPLS